MSGRALALVAVVSHDLDERLPQYFSEVFAYIYGRTRDIQATEALALEAFERASLGSYALLDEDAFAVWLFSAVRQLLISHCRRQSFPGSSASRGAAQPDPLQGPEVARVLEELSRFSLREQDVIALKFDAGLADADIAQVMKLPESTVRAALYRTLRKLQKALNQAP